MDSLGLTAWAALKLVLLLRLTASVLHSLGLTAWAALKLGVPLFWRQRSLRPPIFPGPHGLGSVEARVGSADEAKRRRITRASRPGQR